jgi:riboflavin kinase/FMN adenylyltransferase
LSTFTDAKKIKSLAIGGFDGMHVGHQELFKILEGEGGILVIETGYANLTPSIQRRIHSPCPIFFYDLEDIRHLSGEQFIAKIQTEFPSVRKLVVGYDFHFGKNRAYDTQSLKALFHGEVVVIDEVLVGDISVHSRYIREFIKQGNLQQANHLLGYDYHVKGEIIKGQGLGKKSLVPTLNLDIDGFLLPPEGVYATFTKLDNEINHHPSVSFIGHRTSTDGSFAVETHLLETTIENVNIATIYFIEFLRPNQHFETLEALKAQIVVDCNNADQILESYAL